MLTDNDPSVPVHPSPETPLPQHSFITAELELVLQEAYKLGWENAMGEVREPIRQLIDLNRQLIEMQEKSIEILKGSNYDRYW